MRFMVVRAAAFGPLIDEELQFTPGMNLILGPNESGKSTWLAALFAGLCGRRRGRGRGSKADIEFQEQFLPWMSDEWLVECGVVLDDGREIELSHELLDRVDCHVIDRTTGEDLSGEVMFDGAPDGSRLVGLNRDIVRSVMFIEQGALLAVLLDAANLQVHLQRAADHAEGDATARRAIESLELFVRERLGTERAPTRPIRVTRTRLREGETELSRAREMVLRFLDLLAQRNAASEEAQATASRVGRLRQVQGAKQIAELEGRLAEIVPLASEFTDGAPPDPAGRSRQLSRIDPVLTTWENLPELPKPVQRPTLVELESQLAELPKMPDEDLEPADEIVEVHRESGRIKLELARLDDLVTPEVESSMLGRTDPSELRDLASSVEKGSRAEPPSRRNGPLAFGVAGLFGSALGVALWVAGEPAIGIPALAIGAVVSLVGLLQQMVRREVTIAGDGGGPPKWVGDRLNALELPPDPIEIRRAAVQLERIQGERAETARRDAQRNNLERELEAAAGRLVTLLQPRGISERDSESAYERYVDQCRERRAQALQAARREGLEKELDARRQLQRQADEDLRMRTLAAEQLFEIASELGIDTRGDPDAAARRLRVWRDQEEEAHERRLEAWTRYKRLEGLLAGKTFEDLETERQQLIERVGNVEIDGTKVEGQMDDEIEKLEALVKQQSSKRDNLAGEVKSLEETLPDLAGLEEAQARDAALLVRLEQSAKIVNTAIAYLQEAETTIHRTIAPRLQRAIEERLPAITEGRYREATVDPTDLSVRVKTQDGKWHPATVLSHGTKEQVYLLLRVALAEHLASNDETAPLVLDDVTVHMDTTRTRAVLELLHELSADRQIILFSQEEDVAEWARDSLRGKRDQVLTLEIA